MLYGDNGKENGNYHVIGLCSFFFFFFFFNGLGFIGTPNREPQEHSLNMRILAGMFLLYSWGSLCVSPSQSWCCQDSGEGSVG